MEGHRMQGPVEFCKADGTVTDRAHATHTRFEIETSLRGVMSPADGGRARFVSCTFVTLSSMRVRGTGSMFHVWCITADVDGRVAYVIDSKYARDARDEWERLVDEPRVCALLGDGITGWRVCDVTCKDGQTRPLCTLWTTLLNAAVVGGALTPDTDVYSRIDDAAVIRIMDLVDRDVRSAQAVRTVAAAFAAAVSM
jgi:hypothetical protein